MIKPKGMRKIGMFIIGIMVLGTYSCEKDSLEIGTVLPEGSDVTDGVPVVFSIALNAGLETGTDLVLMSRVTGNEVLTQLKPDYKAVLVKEIDSCWIVDTVIDAKLYTNGTTNYTRGRELKNLTLTLRPGTYRLCMFVNILSNAWNKDLRRGKVVEDPNDKNIKVPYAWQYVPSADKGHSPTYGKEVLFSEAFAGYTEFEVQKNTDVHASALERRDTVNLQRKVGAFRFLLKVGKENEETFDIATAHFFQAYLRPTNGQHFPDGLDVWGKPWYKEGQPRDSLYMYLSTVRDSLKIENGTYASCLINRGSTYFCMFFLAGEQPIHYKLTDFMVTSSSPGPMYTLKEDEVFTGKLEMNKFSGISLVNTGESVNPSGWEDYYYVTQEKNEQGQLVDAAQLFSPFIQWFE